MKNYKEPSTGDQSVVKQVRSLPASGQPLLCPRPSLSPTLSSPLLSATLSSFPQSLAAPPAPLIPGCVLTARTEIEEGGKRVAVGELGCRTSQFIKEAVGTGFQRGEPRGWCVLQQARAERDGLGRCSGFEHLGRGWAQVTRVRHPGHWRASLHCHSAKCQHQI